MERINGPLRPENPGLGYLLKRSIYDLLPSIAKRGSIATKNNPEERICTNGLESTAYKVSSCLEMLPGAALIYQGFTEQSLPLTFTGTYFFISGLTRSLVEISRDDVDRTNVQNGIFTKRRPGTIGLEMIGLGTDIVLDEIDDFKAKREYHD